jgi:AcrR family transcriptional regulator
MRRAPVQARSADRVARMLDAAADLLDEVGPAALTTSAIAARADVSVGSLYQYFPDKHAVVEALAQRAFARFCERLLHVPSRDWRATVDEVIDAYVAFARDEAGFLVLSFGGPVGVRALDRQADNNAVVARALGGVLHEPGLTEDALRVAVEIGDALLTLAFQRDRSGDPALVAEAKTAVTAYLATKLPAPKKEGC